MGKEYKNEKKGYFISIVNIAMWRNRSLTESETSLFKEQRQ